MDENSLAVPSEFRLGKGQCPLPPPSHVDAVYVIFQDRSTSHWAERKRSKIKRADNEFWASTIILTDEFQPLPIETLVETTSKFERNLKRITNATLCSIRYHLCIHVNQ